MKDKKAVTVTTGKVGRKAKSWHRAQAEQILAETVIKAAEYLQRVVAGQIKKPSWARMEQARYVIDQVCGKSRARPEELAGDRRSLSREELLKSADDLVTSAANGGEEIPEPVRQAIEILRKVEENAGDLGSKSIHRDGSNTGDDPE